MRPLRDAEKLFRDPEQLFRDPEKPLQEDFQDLEKILTSEVLNWLWETIF